jgi:hypothetical protein
MLGHGRDRVFACLRRRSEEDQLIGQMAVGGGPGVEVL